MSESKEGIRQKHRRGCLILSAALCLSPALQGASWYVKANAGGNGNGSKSKPFSSLQQVEAASAPGDRIYVVQSPSSQALDGGIQLKNGQKLIGLGPKVTHANQNSARAKLTNTMPARYNGDVVRLANDNVVENIHFDNAYRSSIFGVNSKDAEIRDNLMTRDMSVHNLFAIEGPAPSTCAAVSGSAVCTGEWPNGFILFAPQTNHFGAITLLACGAEARKPNADVLIKTTSYCQAIVPGSGSTASPVHYDITGNVVRDGNSDGIMIINDTGVHANMRVEDNLVKDISQALPDPSSVGSTNHVVRSRGITVITIDESVSNLDLSDFTGSNLSPVGTFASDGIVLLAVGLNPLVNAEIEHILIDNPQFTGEVVNGDSIEIQHRSSTNGILNVDIKDAILKDPANANIKLIDSSNPVNGTYRVTVKDSVLSNINTNGNEESQIRYFATTPGTQVKEISLDLKNVRITGVGRGFGATVTGNVSNVGTLKVKVEDSSFTGLTDEAFQWISTALRTTGTVGGAIFDLGGGPLGSQGRNRIFNNGVPGYVPPGADPNGIDTLEAGLPVVFDADISIANDRPSPNPAIQVWVNNNYWGGGAPVFSTNKGQDIYVPAGSNVTYNPPATYLTTDPN